MKNFTTLILVLALQQTFSQLTIGSSVGNSNFRTIVPYSGSTHNLPLITFAEAKANYKFKKQPISVGLNYAFFVGQRIEESFKYPNSNYWNRSYATISRRQIYNATINYSWLKKKKVELYSGMNMGAYSLVANFSVVLTDNGIWEDIYWDKNRTRIFRGAFGLQSGLIIGEKKFRTKIEVRHVFFGQYEFADFGREMNTSLSVGVLYFMK